MPALRCSATKCVYNKEQLCSRDGIQVDGANARTVDETCCSSFQERTGETNAMESGSGKTNVQVGCKACECSFNNNQSCGAGSISIGGANACHCQETCCGTFQCR